MQREEQQIIDWASMVDEFIVVLDEKGAIVRSNQPWIEFCNAHSLTESLWKSGTDYFRYFKEQEKDGEATVLHQILQKEKTEHKQIYPFVLTDGEIQWFSLKVRPIMKKNQQIQGAFISLKPIHLHTIQPITAESVLESMTDGFYLLDEDLRFNYMNEIGESLLGCKREDVIGKGFLEVFPEAEGSTFHTEYVRALEFKVITEIEEFYEPLNMWIWKKVYPLKRGGLALYFQDISKRKIAEEKLKEYAYYDYLTKLPNRRLLVKKASMLKKAKQKFSVFYINLDNLKFVNALYNYGAGDKVMKKVAERLSTVVTDKCMVGRMDGDEFVVLYQPGTGERLEHLASRLVQLFEEPFLLDDFQAVTIQVSIGIACHPFDTSQLEQLASYSEIAMYEAKKLPGSTYEFFRPKMKVEHDRRSKIEEGLAGNLDELGFEFAVQPQINGETEALVGVEILSRWNHPELGMISPIEFIKVAEQTGAIASMTKFLLEKVFVKMKEWQQNYGCHVRTAINMTPSLLANPAFFDNFFKMIEESGISPTQIEIEITEQAELTYSETTLNYLYLCKEKGISIAIDDFGTGFSMISYLTHFPINKIKIDKYFIQKIGESAKSEALLRSLIHLGKSMECELLAEGVERPEEAEFLKAHECTVFQGYLYDKPMKPEDFEKKYLTSLSPIGRNK